MGTVTPAWREDRYREIYGAGRSAEVLDRIWRAAFGEDYPDRAEPFGFVTVRELARIAEALGVGVGATLLDIGCGRGGPGLWVAEKTGASLIGVDILEEAVVHAAALRHRFALRAEPIFRVGAFDRTMMPSSSVDAVMSVDALWMVLDKEAACREVSRVLAPRSRFVFTTWVPAYLPLEEMLEDAGLAVISYDEVVESVNRQLAVYGAIVAHRDELAGELGTAAAAVLLREAEEAPGRIPTCPRVFAIAEKRP